MDNDYIICKKCGILYDEIICKIKDISTEWYGTNRTTKCPLCNFEQTFNLKDGYFK